MKGTLPMQHFIKDTSDSVNIAFVVYRPSSILEPLRSEVERRAEEGFSVVFLIIQLFGQPEVYEVDVSFRIKHYVLWLEVSVYDPIFMQVLDGEDEFCDDDQCCLWREDSVILDVLTEVSSRHVFKCHVKVLWSLEGIVKWDDVLAFSAFYQGL